MEMLLLNRGEHSFVEYRRTNAKITRLEMSTLRSCQAILSSQLILFQACGSLEFRKYLNKVVSVCLIFSIIFPEIRHWP